MGIIYLRAIFPFKLMFSHFTVGDAPRIRTQDRKILPRFQLNIVERKKLYERLQYDMDKGHLVSSQTAA